MGKKLRKRLRKRLLFNIRNVIQCKILLYNTLNQQEEVLYFRFRHDKNIMFLVLI